MASVSNAFADVPPEELCSADYAKAQDASDLKGLHHQEGVRRPVVHRQEFVIPTKGEVRAGKSGNVTETDMSGNGGHGDDDADEAVYLCGHSLGLQPRRRCEKLPSDTSTCETADGVDGKPNANAQDEASWLHQDVVIREQMAKIVGALPDEVALMYSSMTMNMHFALQNLYQPTKGRYRIIIESSMLSSYRDVVLYHITKHGISEGDLVIINPATPDSVLLTDQDVLSIITLHSATTALLLLPGIISYTGELLDIMAISLHCHMYDIPIGWDLSHVVGNVPLDLHGRNVDFAIWGNDRYMNGGANVKGGVFVHNKHKPAEWSKTSPFPVEIQNGTVAAAEPIPCSSDANISDLACLKASLAIFALTDMTNLRRRSERLTSYLEQLVLNWDGGPRPYKIMTPSKLADRGAQLSLLLDQDLLEPVLRFLQAHGIVVDTATPYDGLIPDHKQKPAVLRVTPAALYNSYHDVYQFVTTFFEACRRATAARHAQEPLPQPPGAFPNGVPSPS